MIDELDKLNYFMSVTRGLESDVMRKTSPVSRGRGSRWMLEVVELTRTQGQFHNKRLSEEFVQVPDWIVEIRGKIANSESVQSLIPVAEAKLLVIKSCKLCT